MIRLISSARGQIDPQWSRYLRLVDRMFWSEQGTFAAGHETPEQLMEQFERHNQEVEASVPPGRLLVWSVTEGWGPLCEFLDVPVPTEPLPHVNDRETFLGRVVDGGLGALQAWRARETEALNSATA